MGRVYLRMKRNKFDRLADQNHLTMLGLDDVLRRGNCRGVSEVYLKWKNEKIIQSTIDVEAFSDSFPAALGSKVSERDSSLIFKANKRSE